MGMSSLLVRIGVEHHKQSKPSLSNIRNAFEDRFQLDLSSSSRKAKHVHIRCMYYAIGRLAGHSFMSIGYSVRRDHSTVMHGIGVHDEIISSDYQGTEKQMSSSEYRKLFLEMKSKFNF